MSGKPKIRSRPTGRRTADRSSTGSKVRRTAGVSQPRHLRPRDWGLVIGGIVAVLAIAVAGWVIASGSPGKDNAASDGTAVQANGGSWTNVTADKLASMLDHKNFTLLNVKTPYSGEIAGTDLYIPYDQLAARAAELPPDKTAKVIVYCRTGHESAIAAQTLIGLGYTHIDNLDGGMTAWTDSGRSLVQLPRT
jgi:rhodanese-related sulfurtransferase